MKGVRNRHLTVLDTCFGKVPTTITATLELPESSISRQGLLRTKGHINQEKQEGKPSATRERCSRKWPTEEKERGEAGEARRRALSQDYHQCPAAVWCCSRTPGTLQLKCTGQGMMWLPLPSACAVGSRLGQRRPVWVSERQETRQTPASLEDPQLCTCWNNSGDFQRPWGWCCHAHPPC